MYRFLAGNAKDVNSSGGHRSEPRPCVGGSAISEMGHTGQSEARGWASIVLKLTSLAV